MEQRLPNKRAMVALAACLALHSLPAQACWEEAAQWYRVNPYLLYAIAKTESGLNPAAINRNKNGSYDIGLMQINSSWLPTLRKHGVQEKDLYDPCTSIQVGAWILSQNMQRMGVTWEAVGAYNAVSPEKRIKYAKKVQKNLPEAALAAQAEADGEGYAAR
ncbi:lytic transglycosylase domain-containing protein [Pseudoduganella violaceinigra]|uniref:lytic transglycosylase domain-containing protein n=1 Tax=Pseudoduganella violaceinigra TaxID=246602 RepID=UPI00040B3D51|nr:lytic transglycosylase domain-containing protein [Pseudoduganella violaceinigra]